MARPRKNDKHLRPCVYARHGEYWYVKGGKWLRLGTTLWEALSEYARFHETPKGGMPSLIETVLVQIKPNLKPSTAAQYAVAARKLARILQNFAPEQAKPKHVAAISSTLQRSPPTALLR